ncbi:MAG: Mrp/NBP35 family ATP-binding protein [Coriobacteriia bacterium]|nr:Mrp/NBP35 family ATP-binding protein [Coriobacteriia bacterium]
MAEECNHQCGSCSVSGCGDRTEMPAPKGRKNIKHIYGVLSGKGGVGKSLVTGLLACALRKKGLKVAVLDADITGPCVPRMFGLKPPLVGDEDGIFPAQTETGIKAISMNLILPEESMHVAWRGPVINGVLTQFWNDIHWEDVDVMLIDMPPGTSDVAFTVLRGMPIEGIVTVSAPQDMVGMIVGKALGFAQNADVPLVGLVENMAYFECGKCGEKHYIYGDPMGEEIAKKYDIPAYAQLPMNPEFARACDTGKIESIDIADALDPIIEQLNVD